MRKLAKGPAIAAAVLSILTVLGIVINFVNYLNVPHITVLSYVSLGLNFVGTVLLIVVLFRGKADTFAAVACFAQLPSILLNVISSVVTIVNLASLIGVHSELSYIVYGNIAGVLANLLRLALFVLMALQCIRRDVRKNTVCIILPIIVAVLATAQVFITLPTSYGVRLGDLFDLSPYMIGTVVGAIIGGILGALPLIFTGMAFGKLRTGEQAPQVPLYQQYQQPPYQQYQQYQVPQQPQYQAPQYQAPQYQAPQYQAPQYQAPQYQAPQYQAPQYQAPQYQAPQYQAPQYQPPQEKPQQ